MWPVSASLYTHKHHSHCRSKPQIKCISNTEKVGTLLVWLQTPTLSTYIPYSLTVYPVGPLF